MNQFYFNVTETITNLPDGDEKERTVVLKKPDVVSVNRKINEVAAPSPMALPTAAPISPQYTQYSSQPLMMNRPMNSEKTSNTGKTMIYVLGGFLIVTIIVIIMLIASSNGSGFGKIEKESTFDQNMAQAIAKISDSDYQDAQTYLLAAKEKLGEKESEEKREEFELYNTANAVFMDVDKLFGGSDHAGRFAYSLSDPSILHPESSASFNDDIDGVLSRLRSYSETDNEVLRKTANKEIAYIAICTDVTRSYEDAQAIGLEFSFDDIKRLYNNQGSNQGQNRDFDNFNSAVKYIQSGIDDLSKGDISTAKGFCFGDDEVFLQMVKLCNELEKFDSFKNVMTSLRKVENRSEDAIIKYNSDPLGAIDLYIEEAGPCASTARMYRDKAIIMCMTNCKKLADEIPQKAEMYEAAYRYYIGYCKENDIDIQVNQIQTSQQG